MGKMLLLTGKGGHRQAGGVSARRRLRPACRWTELAPTRSQDRRTGIGKQVFTVALLTSAKNSRRRTWPSMVHRQPSRDVGVAAQRRGAEEHTRYAACARLTWRFPSLQRRAPRREWWSSLGRAPGRLPWALQCCRRVPANLPLLKWDVDKEMCKVKKKELNEKKRAL